MPLETKTTPKFLVQVKYPRDGWYTEFDCLTEAEALARFKSYKGRNWKKMRVVKSWNVQILVAAS